MKLTGRQCVVITLIGLNKLGSIFCVAINAPFFTKEAESKHVSAALYSLPFCVFSLTICCSGLVFGKFSYKIGLPFLCNSGIFVLGGSYIIFGWLDYVYNPSIFIGLACFIRLFDALGSAAFTTASFAIISVVFKENTGLGFGIMELCSGIGLVLGPIIGGWLYELGDFFLTFTGSGCFLCILGLLTVISLPNVEGDKDYRKPVKNLLWKIIQIPAIQLNIFNLAVIGIAVSCYQVGLQNYLQRTYDLPPFLLGVMFVISGFMHALFSAIWGKLCDNYNRRFIIIIGSILLVISMVFLCPAPYIPMKPSIILNSVSLMFRGIGLSALIVGTFVGFHKDAILYGLPDDEATHGTVSGIRTSIFSLAAALGSLLSGYLIDKVGFAWATQVVALSSFLLLLINSYFEYMVSQVDSSLVSEYTPLILKDSSHAKDINESGNFLVLSTDG